MIDTIIELSHEFGTPHYVLGGGGNSSCKDESHLWVKPSGTTLLGLTAEQLVKMDRCAFKALYELIPPSNVTEREAMVKDLMANAVSVGSSGRPSVEAPLHDTFPHKFVVHTHPAWVNGMTCGRDGKAACERLFPEAMWVPYVDPGYTLCCVVRNDMQAYAARTGHFPNVVVLQNHGVFIAGDSEQEIRELYSEVMDTLECEYAILGLADELLEAPLPSQEECDALHSLIQEISGEARTLVSGPLTEVPHGPLTPDHIVYAKSYALVGELSKATFSAFEQRHGYAPTVIQTKTGVFGLGTNQKDAELALTFAYDGALVQQLTQAFGGPTYLTDASREFIEQWEVEAYRKKIAI